MYLKKFILFVIVSSVLSLMWSMANYYQYIQAQLWPDTNDAVKYAFFFYHTHYHCVHLAIYCKTYRRPAITTANNPSSSSPQSGSQSITDPQPMPPFKPEQNSANNNNAANVKANQLLLQQMPNNNMQQLNMEETPSPTEPNITHIVPPLRVSSATRSLSHYFEKSVIFMGMINNAESTLPFVLNQLDEVTCLFANTFFLFFESNSVDNTSRILRSWRDNETIRGDLDHTVCDSVIDRSLFADHRVETIHKQLIFGDEIVRDELTKEIKKRSNSTYIHKLSRVEKFVPYRNMMLSQLQNVSEYALQTANISFDYIFMIDVDVFEIDFASFLNELIECDTDIMCINGVDQYDDYRDSFATVEMSHNWIFRPFIFNKTDSYYDKARNILRKKMPRQNQRYERVRSCFNGLAAYKLNISEILEKKKKKGVKCKYYSNDDILLLRSKMMRKRQQRQQLKQAQQEIDEYKRDKGRLDDDNDFAIDHDADNNDNDNVGLFQFQKYFKDKANAFINQWDMNINMKLNKNINHDDLDDDDDDSDDSDDGEEQEERDEEEKQNEWIHQVAKLINWSNLKGVMYDINSGYETNLCEHIAFHYCLYHRHQLTISIAKESKLYYYPLLPPPTKEDRRAARRRRRRRAARRQARKDMFNMH